MFGCEWCITAGMTPEQLHYIGEDAGYSGGFFVKDGSPKYFLAHEKVSHNLVMVLDVPKIGLMASLKTQDERNNSIDFAIYKDKRTGAYLLKSKSLFKEGVVIEVFDVIRQIYILLRKYREYLTANPTETVIPFMSSMCNLTSFRSYVEDITEFTAGSLKEFVKFDCETPVASDQILKYEGNTMEMALDALFLSDDIRNAHTFNCSLNSLDDYPQVIIESIFSGVKSYDKKAQLLMEMLSQLILTEHQIIPQSDRDNLGNKSYLIAAEILKRDLTMNNGERFA